MRGCIFVATVALAACSIDSTGLLPGDTGARLDVRVPMDTGPLEDAPLLDTAAPDTSIADVGPGDVPMDIPVPTDVPTDTFDGGPVVPGACEGPSVVACYLFDGDVLDSSVHARHLTAGGVEFDAVGAVGDTLILDETSQVSLPGVRFGLGSESSVELWFRMSEPIDVTDSRWAIVDAEGSWGVFVYRTGSPENVRLETSYGGRRTVRNVPVREWHHLVAVSNNSELVVHVDGVARESSEPISSTDETGDLHVGSRSDPAAFDQKFVGSIDHLRIWNRALDEAEVTALFVEE